MGSEAVASGGVRFHASEGIGWLVLDRPERHNAQTPGMWERVREIGEEVCGDDNVRCVIVGGEGPSFSAGLDLDAGAQDLASRMSRDSNIATLAHSFDWLRMIDRPTIAAVHGHAYGAGLQLALACDIRILSEDSTVGFFEINHGLVADMGATEHLPRIVGLAVAAELLFTGRAVSAEEALRIGLANQIVPRTQLRSEALTLAKALCERSRMALGATKEALALAFDAPGASHRHAAQAQVRCVNSEEFQIALEARARRQQRSSEYSSRGDGKRAGRTGRTAALDTGTLQHAATDHEAKAGFEELIEQLDALATHLAEQTSGPGELSRDQRLIIAALINALNAITERALPQPVVGVEDPTIVLARLFGRAHSRVARIPRGG